MAKKNVLLVGESWATSATHTKGFDQFGSVTFHLGAEPLVTALKGSDFDLTYMPAHEAATAFPFDLDGLERYDAIILSDIGANTFLLSPDVWLHGKPTPNRLKLIREWTRVGGGLVMIGGYFSFQGIDGKARWRATPVEEALPVSCFPYDDRLEIPEGFSAQIVGAPDHPVLAGTRRPVAPPPRRQRGAREGSAGGRGSGEAARGGRWPPAARRRRVWRRALARLDVGHRAALAACELRGMARLSASLDQCAWLGDASHLRGSMTTPLLQARSITKRFGALQALADVDVDIHAGEVLAILGDNGAGKSTFIKILSGAYEPSAGTLLLDGAPVSFASPQDAADVGIATIFQELALSENLSIAENVFLGRELVRRVLGVPFLKRQAMKQKVAELLNTLEAHISDPEAAVGSLSGGQRQAVAISRALNLNARLVIMDEPTAALAVAETRKVLQLIRRLAEGGRAVILISHNMHDVFEVADRIVVFRRGRKIAERRRSETDPEEVVSFITGAHPDVRALEMQA